VRLVDFQAAVVLAALACLIICTIALGHLAWGWA
jgi:hypothetical protein